MNALTKKIDAGRKTSQAGLSLGSADIITQVTLLAPQSLPAENVLSIKALQIGGYIALVLVVQRLLKKRRPNLPPGPTGWPIIGNLFDMPKEMTWLTFSEWGRIYGDISSVTVLGKTLVIINSLKVAQKTLNEKGSIYSDRPNIPLGGEMIGWGNAIPFLRYGPTFQFYRKRFHQLFGTHTAAKVFHDSEMQSVQDFLNNIYASPDDLIPYIKKHVGTVALKIVYGYDVTDKEDEFVSLLDRGMENFSMVTAPLSSAVDVFPFLKHLPSWFPGGGFHSEAEAGRKVLMDMAIGPYSQVKDKSPTATSFLSTFLTSDATEEDIRHFLWNASSVAAGGFSTRLAMIQAFFILMALHPEVQIKARAEIKAVVGTDRFPTFEDRPSLPYIDAICREVFRVYTIVPNGLPHMVVEDDYYDGYLIPKGSIIIANLWNMLHDPDTYKDPFDFNPSRFVVTEDHVPERDVYDIIFGFGRRICPGRVLADGSLFIMAAMSLAVLDISNAIDNHGNAIKPGFQPRNGVVSQPKPFKCSIKAHSPEASVLLNSLKST
ncbi:hypothetical protein H0H93_009461 [Arthromyces matolae]|nr:hypothetical protein H0H93_009461 [Arthromyces matolae]